MDIREAIVPVLAVMCGLTRLRRDNRREELIQGRGAKYTHEVAALPYDVELVKVFYTCQWLTCIIIRKSPRNVRPQYVVQVIKCVLKEEDNLRYSFPFLHVMNNAGDVV